MSAVTLEKGAPQLTHEVVKSLVAKAGLALQERHVDDYAKILEAIDPLVQHIMDEEDYMPKPDLIKYPRINIRIPEDTDKGGWAVKFTAKCTEPKNDLLNGRTVALKDNTAFAGVRCTNGTKVIGHWVPEVDAKIATRIMDSGGIITGKSACENACFEGVSQSSCTGKVHNPYADNYSAGGSSSGSGRLVATGSVDMAIGADQAGSIRIPAANCGIVGLKPTWGLVPYTGILSLECTIDHAGPMTKTVRDAALLLEAMAGPDGIDDRQPAFLPPKMLEYTSQLDLWMNSVDTAKPLSGIKVGFLEEGFTIPNMDPNVHKLCSGAVDKMKELGATVLNISVPSHHHASALWMCNLAMAGVRQGLLADMTGRKQLYMTDRVIASSDPLTQQVFDDLGPAAQNFYLRYLYLKEKYGPTLHAKARNLLRKVSDDYDRALASADVLVMPTLPTPPVRLMDNPSEHGPLEHQSRNIGRASNTCPFNSSGHPALTIPVGFVPAQDNKDVMLPIGLQIVGKKFADIDCLKVGAAWEKMYDWKKL